MANSKLLETKNLLEQYQGKVTENVEEWQSFLTTASNNHKYNFPSQLLIFAQRPEATACADFKVWSEQVGRQIIQGSKGIPIVTKDRGGREKLVHLFDVIDTKPREHSKPVKLWEIQPHLEAPVLEQLQARHGTTSQPELGGALLEICENICRDHCDNTLDELHKP